MLSPLKNYIVGFFLILSLHVYGESVINKDGKLYLSGRVIFKVTDRNFDFNKLSMLFQKKQIAVKIQENNLKQVIPETANNASNQIERIYEIKYLSPYDPIYISSKLMEFDVIEWAEPRYLYRTSFIPNDPYYNPYQWHLKTIKADLAWDITTGDEQIVIAIVDTGVDWLHSDLYGNIWINNREIPDNGIDDDNNGYIDDVRGWDFGGLDGTPDNDPREDRPDHGTHVAGIAGAMTNNGIGIASIGYNCKIMPVKTSQDNIRWYGYSLIVYGYEGVIYAAQNGAKVINCSWGGPDFSYFGKEAIDFAISNGSVVVAAAGNTFTSDPSYPAAYDGVISVAAIDSLDKLSVFSNYGEYITICAPGEDILSAWQSDDYIWLSGTSMASPLVAGVAALVAKEFPDYSPRQIREQIRVNGDNIDSLNIEYISQLGGGKLNAFKALNNRQSYSFRPIKIKLSDEPPYGNGNGLYEPGEIIAVFVEFQNLLNPIQYFKTTLLTNAFQAYPMQNKFDGGSLTTAQKIDNFHNPYTLLLNGNIKPNEIVKITIQIEATSYFEKYNFTFEANQTYATLNANNISVSFSSYGEIGYDWKNNKGEGFRYKWNENLFSEGSLIYGISENIVCDSHRDSVNKRKFDFKPVQNFYVKNSGSISDVEGYAVFSDENAGERMIGIETTFRAYAWKQNPYRDFIVLRYSFKNKSFSDIDNFYGGLVLDWDFYNERVFFDQNNEFAYVVDIDNFQIQKVGMATLNTEKLNFFALNKKQLFEDIYINDGLTNKEKWKLMTGGLRHPENIDSGDAVCYITQGPYDIPMGGEVNMYFILACSNSHDSLLAAIALARQKILELSNVESENNFHPDKYVLYQNYPNPFNQSTVISYYLSEEVNVKLEIYDVLGKKISILVNEKQSPGMKTVIFDDKNLASGIYFYRLMVEDWVISKKMILLK